MKRYFDLNLKTDNNYCDDIDSSSMVEIPDDGKPYSLVDNKVVCISETDEYKKKIRIAKINKELKEVASAYDTCIDTPVTYTNGFTYKPSYAKDNYATLLDAQKLIDDFNSRQTDDSKKKPNSFPQVIKDSTKLADRQLLMSYDELLTLSLYLGDLQGKAWKIKADKEAALIAEQKALQAG